MGLIEGSGNVAFMFSTDGDGVSSHQFLESREGVEREAAASAANTAGPSF
jgi:hypothetical protein